MSNASSLCRRNARIMASSSPLRTEDRGALGPVLRSSAVSRLRHFATVLGLMPSFRPSSAIEACLSRDHAAHSPAEPWIAELSLGRRDCPLMGRHAKHCRGAVGGAPVMNPFHNASVHTEEGITPSNRGIKYPGSQDTMNPTPGPTNRDQSRRFCVESAMTSRGDRLRIRRSLG